MEGMTSWLLPAHDHHLQRQVLPEFRRAAAAAVCWSDDENPGRARGTSIAPEHRSRLRRSARGAESRLPTSLRSPPLHLIHYHRTASFHKQLDQLDERSSKHRPTKARRHDNPRPPPCSRTTRQRSFCCPLRKRPEETCAKQTTYGTSYMAINMIDVEC